MSASTDFSIASTPLPGAAVTHAWFAVRVKSRQERVVAASLAGKGYDQFLPLYRSTRRWADRRKDIDVPLFDGYVFARFDYQERLPVLKTPGVVYIAGTGRLATPVSDAEMAAIQAIVRSGLPAAPWPFLEVGQRVRVERGPLEGAEGILVSVKNCDRIIISISLLQRSVSAEIDREWLRPVSGWNRSRCL